jgi:hypothetical protein
MKVKLMVLAVIGLVVGSFIFIGIGVNAASVYDDNEGYNTLTVSSDQVYSVEEMLVAAIEDEYLAQATYQAIIDAFGNIRPFSKIILAEQAHIDLLLPLFEAYGIEVPVNNASEFVVLPESISSALATGIEAETLNIAMYQVFLGQEGLPEDLQAVFELLLNASENHLRAFSRDRIAGVCSDVANSIQNRFRNGGRNGNQNNNQNCTGSSTGRQGK